MGPLQDFASLVHALLYPSGKGRQRRELAGGKDRPKLVIPW